MFTPILDLITHAKMMIPRHPLLKLYKLKDYGSFPKNICSVHAKITELRLIVQDCRPHVIALMETKLNDAICDMELDIPGYDLYRQDRTRNGGGVAVSY